MALKTLPPELNHSPEDLEAVRDNFKLVTKLAHPNIAQLKHLHHVDQVRNYEGGVHIDKGEYLVVMEYVEGSTLRNWLKQFPDKKASYTESLKVCQQVAEALDFAHSKKIIHRDIKPGNIMISSEGEVKVLDFGLAAEVRSSMSRISKDTGSSSGTRPYMPPEQLLGRKQNHTADQYALAAMLYEMISGEVPFQSVFETNDMQLICQVVPNNAVENLEELSKKQNAVLLRALAKNKEERFTSCQALIEALSTGKLKAAGKKPGKLPVGIVLGGIAAVGVVVFLMVGTQSEVKPVVKSQVPSKPKIKADPETPAVPQELELTDEQKISKLVAQAKKAFKLKDYAQASAQLQELFSLDETNEEGLNLQEKIDENANLQSIIPVKSEAEFLAEKLLEIGTSDGFEDELDQLKLTLKNGENYFSSQAYEQAMKTYAAYTFRAKNLLKADKARGAYKTKKVAYLAAREKIDFNKMREAFETQATDFLNAERAMYELENPKAYEKALTQMVKQQKGLESFQAGLKNYELYSDKYTKYESEKKKIAEVLSQAFVAEYKKLSLQEDAMNELVSKQDYIAAAKQVQALHISLLDLKVRYDALMVQKNKYLRLKESLVTERSASFYEKYAPQAFKQFGEKLTELSAYEQEFKYAEALEAGKSLLNEIKVLEKAAGLKDLEDQLKSANSEADKWHLASQLLVLDKDHDQAKLLKTELQPKWQFKIQPANASIYLNGILQKAELISVNPGEVYKVRVTAKQYTAYESTQRIDFFGDRSFGVVLELAQEIVGKVKRVDLDWGIVIVESKLKNIKINEIVLLSGRNFKVQRINAGTLTIMPTDGRGIDASLQGKEVIKKL